MIRMSRPLGLGALMLALIVWGCSSSDEQPERLASPYAPPAETPESMEEYLEQQSPGAQHAQLEPLIGCFSAQVKHWIAPDQPPAESTGVIENTWVLGGRFVLTQYKGDNMGLPFEGMGLLGYDTVKQKYVGNWADTWATSLWPTGTGEANESGDAFTLSRVMTDPMTGGLIKIRDVTTIVDRDHITYEMFITHPGTDEFKMLEAQYIRT